MLFRSAFFLIEGTGTHKNSLDNAISSYAQDWDLDRMPAIDLAIARIASFEILYSDEVDDAVAIDEAVELAKEFSTEQSANFLNGLLGRILVVKDALA